VLGEENHPTCLIVWPEMPTVAAVAMLLQMLEQDRKRAGWSVARAAWELGVSIREYRGLETGKRMPNWETFDRICKLYGWPQTFLRAPS
jgi:DNA-binding XRE family transcriptional regulator